MDCNHKTFSVFVTAYLPSRSEINQKANVYQNFFNKNGVPKTKIRHKVKGKYTLKYHRNKIKDDKIKRKFDIIRKQLKSNDPLIQEEYTKKRISYWDASNRCLYALEPHRKNLWLGIIERKQLKGYRQYFDHNKTYFRIDKKSDVKKVLALFWVERSI